MEYEFSCWQMERRSVPGSALEPALYPPVFCGRRRQPGRSYTALTIFRPDLKSDDLCMEIGVERVIRKGGH